MVEDYVMKNCVIYFTLKTRKHCVRNDIYTAVLVTIR